MFCRYLKKYIFRWRAKIEQRKFSANNRWFLQRQKHNPRKPNHSNARFSQNVYAGQVNLQGIQRPQNTRDSVSVWDTVSFAIQKIDISLFKDIPYELCKFCCDRSIIKFIVLEVQCTFCIVIKEQCTFSAVSQLPLEGCPWQFIPDISDANNRKF